MQAACVSPDGPLEQGQHDEAPAVRRPVTDLDSLIKSHWSTKHEVSFCSDHHHAGPVYRGLLASRRGTTRDARRPVVVARNAPVDFDLRLHRARTLAATVLILPGIGNSGPEHWQSIWEESHPEFTRVQQRDWDKPVCEEWVAAVEGAAKRVGSDVVLVAHSLACLVVAHWAAQKHAPIKAALLVAVPNSEGASFPAEARGFSTTPTQAFSFPSVVVVSDDDPYGSPEHSAQLAAAWGSRLVHVGNRGHINASSGLGAWPEGYALLSQLRT